MNTGEWSVQAFRGRLLGTTLHLITWSTTFLTDTSTIGLFALKCSNRYRIDTYEYYTCVQSISKKQSNMSSIIKIMITKRIAMIRMNDLIIKCTRAYRRRAYDSLKRRSIGCDVLPQQLTHQYFVASTSDKTDDTMMVIVLNITGQ